jgi:dihydroneopterin aldolase
VGGWLVVNPLDSIVLTGLRAFGHHGVLAQERRDGQEFVVDVTAFVPARGPDHADDIATTVHYGELAEQIVAAVERDPVDLIETLAERLAEVVLSHELVVMTQVTVHKPGAPLSVPFSDVAVSISRGRV